MSLTQPQPTPYVGLVPNHERPTPNYRVHCATLPFGYSVALYTDPSALLQATKSARDSGFVSPCRACDSQTACLTLIRKLRKIVHRQYSDMSPLVKLESKDSI